MESLCVTHSVLVWSLSDQDKNHELAQELCILTPKATVSDNNGSELRALHESAN